MVSASATQHPPHTHTCENGHCHIQENTTPSRFQRVLEMTCRIGLSVIAFITSPISSACGTILGIGYGMYTAYVKTNQDHQEHSGNGGGCSGFLEELSGIRFPKALNTIAAFGVTVEHLMHGYGHHHSPIPFSIFGTLSGISTGAWLGQGIWHVGRQINAWASKGG